MSSPSDTPQFDGTVGVPADLVNDLRIAAAVLLTSACDDFTQTLGSFDDTEAWDLLPERLADVEQRIAWLRALGVEKDGAAVKPLPKALVAAVAREASGNLLDDLHQFMREESDINALGYSFGTAERMAARGKALLALSEEAQS
jgi:hypothetical protein